MQCRGSKGRVGASAVVEVSRRMGKEKREVFAKRVARRKPCPGQGQSRSQDRRPPWSRVFDLVLLHSVHTRVVPFFAPLQSPPLDLAPATRP